MILRFPFSTERPLTLLLPWRGHPLSLVRVAAEEALLRSVVLAGGNTMFRGIGARMEKVLSTLAAAALQLQAAKRRLALGGMLPPLFEELMLQLQVLVRACLQGHCRVDEGTVLLHGREAEE